MPDTVADTVTNTVADKATNTVRKIISSWAIALIVAIIVSGSFAILFGHSSYDVDGLRLSFGIEPSAHGQTELAIPPFGEVTAATHKTPLRIRVAIERIYPHEISQVADKIDTSGKLVQKIETEGKKAFRQFIIRLLALAAIGGMLGAALSPRRRVYKGIAGVFVGVAFVGSLLWGTYSTFNVNAFKQPSYSGALTAAPWATEEIAKRLSDIKALKKEISTIAANVDSFYSKIDSWHPIKEDTIKVLHVSDIHNNPVALDLIKRVVKDFNVDLVIDTGDITDFGTPVETKLTSGISTLSVPYVFVPGNHESSATVTLMRHVKNAVVLDGKPVTVKGITILGFADPASTSTQVAPVNDAAMAAFRRTVKKELDSQSQKPLILAVHNPKAVKGLLGQVPIILVGHTHHAELTEKDGCVIDNAGTTGAAGLRTFQNESGVPYTLSLLHIDRSKKALVAIDSLAVTGSEMEFRLERNLIKGKEASETELGMDRFGHDMQEGALRSATPKKHL